MEGVFAIIGFFGLIPLIVWIVHSYGTRRHAQALGTANKLIERGDQITKDILQALGTNPVTSRRDLKIGMILVAVAVSIIIIGRMIPDDSGDVAQITLGVSSLPFLIGLVYLVFWFIARKEE